MQIALPRSPSWIRFLPFLAWFGEVDRRTLRADAMAGLTGAVIVLPQGVAFAMIAGLPPQYGLYTAIITPIVAALFGSSRHLISGPTTAISIVVFSAISAHAEPGSAYYVQLALTLTFLAGAYQLAFGLARLGRLVNFVSHSVVVGFTAGAAILIATSQLKHVLGIAIPRGESFLHTWQAIFENLGVTNPYVFSVAMVTLASALLFKRFVPRLPYMLLAMLVGAVLSLVLDGPAHGVALVGEIPGRLPPLSLPDFSFGTVRQLAPEAFAVALLGLIEAVSIGRSIATKSQQRIDGNQEFVGQGLSNIIGSFFSAYAGSGSFTRSGINYQAGAKTPMAAIFAAALLAAILLVIAPLTAYLPIPAMGGIILLVAYNLIDTHHIQTIFKASRSETVVLVVTFAATLLLELEFAIYAGVLLSLVFFLNRTAHPEMASVAPDKSATPRRFVPVARDSYDRCPQLEIMRIDGSIFFGSVNDISGELDRVRREHIECTHALVVANAVNVIDVSGAELLAQEAEAWRKRGGGFHICGLKPDDISFLERGGYMETIGRENLFHSKKDAIGGIMERLNPVHCEYCSRRVFDECRAI